MNLEEGKPAGGATSDEAPSRWGYGLGVGLVFIPVAGIPLRFAFQGITPLLVYVAVFLLGLGVGALMAPRGRRRQRELP